MNSEQNMAPNVISCKDLDYLKDIFGWNCMSYKIFSSILENIEDEDAYTLFEDCIALFYENLEEVLNILESGEFYE